MSAAQIEDPRRQVSEHDQTAGWRAAYCGWLIFFALIVFLKTAVALAADDTQQSPRNWQEIKALATAFVARESPSSVWPFERAGEMALSRNQRKVFAHYFPPFPLSPDNHRASEDYYARELLRREGENNKYHDVGGYLRERPMPMPPWPENEWQEVGLGIEILRAKQIGIDGFGIDLLSVSGPLWSRTKMLYDVAAAVAPEFQIVAEPDMSALKNITEQELVASLAELLSHPAAYRLPDGRAVVIPFLAEAKSPAFWRQVMDDLAARNLPVALIPDFLDPARENAYSHVSSGFTYWGLRDPITVAAHPSEAWFKASAGLPGFIFMAPVAPQDARPRDAVLWEAHNSTSFRTLWLQAINGSAQYVHLITWNDYSESSEISPSTGTQFVFYDLAAYFIQWFKLKQAPPIRQDAIFYTQRRQIFHPDRRPQPGDKFFEVKGLTKLSNLVEMIAFLQAPATLEIELGGEKFEKAGVSGLNVFHIPAQHGRPIFRILRNSTAVAEKISDWTISDRAERHDPLYVGGSSTRPFVPENLNPEQSQSTP